MKRRSFLGVLAAAVAARKLPATPAPTYADELNALLDDIEAAAPPSLDAIAESYNMEIHRIYTRVALDDLAVRATGSPLSQQFAALKHAQFTGRRWIFGLNVTEHH